MTIINISNGRRAFIAVLALAISSVAGAMAQEKSIVIASTTSAKDSGLFARVLPIFTQKTGIAVNVLAVGTGQALDAARRGETDVVFVHAKIAEQQFIAFARKNMALSRTLN